MTPTEPEVLEGQLEIYLVDVEGGQATVIVFPNRDVMVVDAGLQGMRDPGRILDVLRNEVGTERIEYFLTTHYDADHVGGVPDVAAQMEVGTFMDHGNTQAPNRYLMATAQGERRIISPGDTLDSGAVHLDFVSAARQLITTPLPGGGEPNPFCENAVMKPAENENAASVGFILRFGEFDFLNLADLLWDYEHRLVCPVNLLGTVDLYLTTHHGLDQSGATQMVRAVNPLAAVMNNGPRKGGGGGTWQTLQQAPGGENVWQLHLNLDVPANQNAPEEQIANLASGNQDPAHFLKITVNGDGSFVIENPRNSFSKTYQSR